MKLKDALFAAVLAGMLWFSTWAACHIRALETRVDAQSSSIITSARANLKLTDAVLTLEEMMMGTYPRTPPTAGTVEYIPEYQKL